MPVPTADSCMRSPAPRHLLPPVVPEPAAPRRSGRVLCDAGCGPSTRASEHAGGAIRARRSVPEQKVELARVWIETHPDLRPSLSRLARVAGVSPWHLQRTFKRLLGVTPAEYAQARRAARLKPSSNTARSPTPSTRPASGRPAGSTRRPGRLGMTPRAYRAGGRGEQIRFTTLTTRLGVMLVAAPIVACAGSPSATTRRPGTAPARRVSAADVAGTAPAWRPRSLRCGRPPLASRSPRPWRSTCARRPFNGESGAPCRTFRWADPHLRGDRPADRADLGRPAPSPGPAPPIRSRSPCPVTGSCRPPGNRRVPLGQRKKEEAAGG